MKKDKILILFIDLETKNMRFLKLTVFSEHPKQHKPHVCGSKIFRSGNVAVAEFESDGDEVS
jgi:hypothetical protein